MSRNLNDIDQELDVIKKPYLTCVVNATNLRNVVF